MVDNEIGFVRTGEFRKMAPEIVRMEIRRLGRMIASFDRATDRHNALVRARYELGRFVERLEDGAEEGGERKELLAPLEAAMLALSVEDVADADDADDSNDARIETNDTGIETQARGDEELEDPAERIRHTQETPAYVRERLRYVHERLHLLY